MCDLNQILHDQHLSGTHQKVKKTVISSHFYHYYYYQNHSIPRINAQNSSITSKWLVEQTSSKIFQKLEAHDSHLHLSPALRKPLHAFGWNSSHWLCPLVLVLPLVSLKGKKEIHLVLCCSEYLVLPPNNKKPLWVAFTLRGINQKDPRRLNQGGGRGGWINLRARRNQGRFRTHLCRRIHENFCC